MRSRACVSAVAGAVASALVIGAASAHDEDWRKLVDQQPPVAGPIWRAGDEVPRDGFFDSMNVEIYSIVPVNNFPSPVFANASDCWGYTSPSGREIAIMGLAAGHGFVDITVPTDPQVIGVIDSPTSVWHDVKTVGEFAYAVTEGGGGVQIIDLSQVDSGVVTLANQVFLGGHTTTHNIAANEESGFVYLCGANIGNGGLVALDVSDPENPTVAGGFTERYVHDAQVVTYPPGFGIYSGREIAYCFSESRVDIVDVTDKSAMTLLSSATYPGVNYTHQGWLSEDKQYLYVNDELDEQNVGFPTRTFIFRVWDPTGTASPESPEYLTSFIPGNTAIDHNLYTHDGLVFQANYRSGLRVLDATIPDAPVLAAYLDTFPGSDAASFNGAWSVYPYFPSGTVIVSDLERGLFVLGVDVPQIERLVVRFDSEPPAVVTPGQVLPIVARIDEQNVTLDAGSVQLELLDAAGAVIGLIPMSSAGGNLYSADAPAVECGDGYALRIVAASTSGLAYSSVIAEGFAEGTASVVSTDNANTNTGWTASAVPTSGAAVAGQWGIGVPVGDRGGPGVDADGSGSAWLTGPGAGNTDVDNGIVVLESPVYDLSGGGEVSLSYWFGTIDGGPPLLGDEITFDVSDDGGANWSRAVTVTTPQQAWREVTLRFADGGDAMPSAQARVRVSVADIGQGAVVEGAIDNIVVSTYECVTIADCGIADVTTLNTNPGDAGYGSPDGAVDGADLSFYVEAWLAGGTSADVTTLNTNPGDAGYGSPDGTVDGADLSFFVEAWLAGCVG